MPSNLIKLTLSVVLIFVLSLAQPQTAVASIEVVDRELVSKQRVGRTTYQYTYRLSVDVQGTQLNDVTVYVSCDSPGTTLVDDVVEFGDIPGNAVSISTGTFSLRQNRRVPFDPNCLGYEIGFDTPLIMSGTATDLPLSGADIRVTITRPSSGRPIVESGRPIVETFGGTADEDGNYTVTADTITTDGFVSIMAVGVGEQEGAVLTSSVGSVGFLHELGIDGSIVVDSGMVGSLNVTHITTAMDELVRRLNGGVMPTTDGALAALQAQVDGAELLLLATTIKTFIDNPHITLPPGYNTTLELIQDEAAVDAATLDLQTNFTAEFELAMQETADNLGLAYDEAEIISMGTMYAVQPNEKPLQGVGAFEFVFDANFGGTVTMPDGFSPITWLINAQGEIEVALLDPPPIESYPYRDPPGAQVRSVTYTDLLRIVRLAEGVSVDKAFILPTVRTTFPDDGLPDEVIEYGPAPERVYETFGEDNIVPIEASDIAGSQIAAYYFHTDNASIGVSTNGELGADFLFFDANGTGTTQRRGFVFDWSIDSVGGLVVEFANGDSNRFLLHQDGDIGRAIVIAGLVGGETYALNTRAMDFDGVSEFTVDMLENRRYRWVTMILEPNPNFDAFDYVFLPGGEGCRQLSTASPGNPFSWVSTPESYMDGFRYNSFSPDPYARRSWQVIRVEPGILGDRYWLIENADFGGFPFLIDPTETPGRINAYEFVEDLTGQFDPCILGGPNSLLTTFASNNGGVGNMFDVSTIGGAIEVTGFDVNLTYTAGTPFDVTIYTAPNGWEDTLTSAPGCVFNCSFDTNEWTQVAVGTGNAAGQDLASFVSIDPFVLDGFATTGIWITLTRDGSVVDEFRYTSGSGTVDNADIEIIFGAGVTGQAAPGIEGATPNRVWNGTIYYNNR